jgi:hypothetical protein
MSFETRNRRWVGEGEIGVARDGGSAQAMELKKGGMGQRNAGRGSMSDGFSGTPSRSLDCLSFVVRC